MNTPACTHKAHMHGSVRTHRKGLLNRVLPKEKPHVRDGTFAYDIGNASDFNIKGSNHPLYRAYMAWKIQ